MASPFSSGLMHLGWGRTLLGGETRTQRWGRIADKDAGNVTGNISTLWKTEYGTLGYEMDPMIETFNILVTCVLAFVMFGLGCAVDYDELKKTFKRPVEIFLGISCQVILMPLIAFCLVKMASISDVEALSFFCIGCCPGGLISNIVSIIVEGDMPLSMALTTITNFLAFGTVPIWLLIYSAIEEVHDDIRIPYSTLAVSLVSMVVPIALGVLFRINHEKAAKFLAPKCAAVGLIVVFGLVIAISARNEVPLEWPVKIALPIIMLPVTGTLISYALTLIPKLGLCEATKKTIAVETSIQNSTLANNIVFLTYSNRLHIFTKVITIPLMYATVQSMYNVFLMAVYKGWQFRKKNLEHQNADQNIDEAET